MRNTIRNIISHAFLRCYNKEASSSQWHHVPGLLFINVWYLSHGGADHPDRGAPTELHLIADELFPEAVVGPHHRAAAPHPAVGPPQRLPAVLHQIGHAQRGGAAHPGVAVHQSPATELRSQLDLIRHIVEVFPQSRGRGVGQWDVDVLHPAVQRTAALRLRHVHDAGDVAPNHLGGVVGGSAITEVQVVGDSAQAGETCETRLMHKTRGIQHCQKNGSRNFVNNVASCSNK